MIGAGFDRDVPFRQHRIFAWRQQLFALMFKNAANATDFFHIPPNRVIELGSHVYLDPKKS